MLDIYWTSKSDWKVTYFSWVSNQLIPEQVDTTCIKKSLENTEPDQYENIARINYRIC